VNDAARAADERQADALIEEIARKAGEARARIAADSAREADEIRARARTKARRQLRRAVQEMRASAQGALAQVRAEIETARSRSVSEQALRSLALAWPQLAAAIARRWDDGAARAQWIAAQLETARARLPAPPWTVRHPADWGEADVAALRAALALRGADGATLHADAALGAGLVVESAGARLDSTPSALLADRSAVEATLLAATARQADAGVPRRG